MYYAQRRESGGQRASKNEVVRHQMQVHRCNKCDPFSRMANSPFYFSYSESPTFRYLSVRRSLLMYLGTLDCTEHVTRISART